MKDRHRIACLVSRKLREIQQKSANRIEKEVFKSLLSVNDHQEVSVRKSEEKAKGKEEKMLAKTSSRTPGE